MIHEKQRIQISLYIDEELDPSAEREVFDHLSDCDECRGFLRRSIRLRADMIREPLRLQVSPGTHIESRKALLQRQTRSILGRRISLPVPIAAVIAVVVLASAVALSTLWIRPKEKTQEASKEVIYVPRIPAIQVVGFYPPKTDSKK